jgi:hypothetical protein
MAEIVQSLFGVSPESYQMAQQQRADQQAMQYARLDPFQQANFAIGRGANMLGGAVAGALGGQDPELQRISMRQQIARQLNPNDAASIQQALAMLQQSGDAEGAMMLQGEYRKLQESNALVAQRGASAAASMAQAGRERTQASPKEVQLAQAVAALSGFPEGTPEYNTVYAASLQDQMAPKEPKGPAFGTDREAVAAEVYGKPFGQLTQPERAAVNKRVEEEGSRKAAAGAAKLVLPGEKALVDIPGFRATVQKTIEPQAKAVFAADNALTNIEDSIRTGNFASYRAAQVQFAKAIAGAGDLSQKELKAAGADPALLGGTADYLSSLFTSTPTLDTQNKIKSTLQAIKKVSTDKANAEIDSQRKIALRNKGYDPDAVNAALNFPEFQAAPAAGGGTLAEQAAALLKARQGARPTSGGR